MKTMKKIFLQIYYYIITIYYDKLPRNNNDEVNVDLANNNRNKFIKYIKYKSLYLSNIEQYECKFLYWKDKNKFLDYINTITNSLMELKKNMKSDVIICNNIYSLYDNFNTNVKDYIHGYYFIFDNNGIIINVEFDTLSIYIYIIGEEAFELKEIVLLPHYIYLDFDYNKELRHNNVKKEYL